MIFVAETYSAWWYNKIVAFSESAVHSVASSNFGQLNASFDSDELLKTRGKFFEGRTVFLMDSKS